MERSECTLWWTPGSRNRKLAQSETQLAVLCSMTQKRYSGFFKQVHVAEKVHVCAWCLDGSIEGAAASAVRFRQPCRASPSLGRRRRRLNKGSVSQSAVIEGRRGRYEAKGHRAHQLSAAARLEEAQSKRSNVSPVEMGLLLRPWAVSRRLKKRPDGKGENVSLDASTRREQNQFYIPRWEKFSLRCSVVFFLKDMQGNVCNIRCCPWCWTVPKLVVSQHKVRVRLLKEGQSCLSAPDIIFLNDCQTIHSSSMPA